MVYSYLLIFLIATTHCYSMEESCKEQTYSKQERVSSEDVATFIFGFQPHHNHLWLNEITRYLDTLEEKYPDHFSIIQKVINAHKEHLIKQNQPQSSRFNQLFHIPSQDEETIKHFNSTISSRISQQYALKADRMRKQKYIACISFFSVGCACMLAIGAGLLPPIIKCFYP